MVYSIQRGGRWGGAYATRERRAPRGGDLAHAGIAGLLAQLSRHRGGPVAPPPHPPLAPVLYRVPALFGVPSCRAAFAFSG